MNTKLNNIIVNGQFKDILNFKSKDEKIEHNSQMISFRILNEVERVCESRNIKKKDLAEMIGTSKSFITQLFNGNKSINTSVMAKIEEALDLSFDIFLKSKSLIAKDDSVKAAKNGGALYCAYKKDRSNYYLRPTYAEILENLETNNEKSEKLA